MVEGKQICDYRIELPGKSITVLYRILYNYYGPQGWWPLRSRRIGAGAEACSTLGFNSSGYHPGTNYVSGENDIFEIAAGAVLTQNTNWRNASSALDSLIKTGLLNPEKILETEATGLAEIIRASGYYNQKAVKLKGLAALMINLGTREPTREDLLSVWGIGPETADSIMLYAFNKPYFIIDTYTRRVLSRFTGIDEINSADYDELRVSVERVFRTDINSWQEYHALIVKHAKKFCSKAIRCTGCPLSQKCKKRK